MAAIGVVLFNMAIIIVFCESDSPALGYSRLGYLIAVRFRDKEQVAYVGGPAIRPRHTASAKHAMEHPTSAAEGLHVPGLSAETRPVALLAPRL